MARPVEAFVSAMETAGLGILGDSLFWGAGADLPEGPGPFVTVLETGGLLPLGTHQEPRAILQPSFQVATRGRDPIATAARADQVSAFALVNTAVAGWFFLWARAMQEAFALPNDANQRVRFVVNFRIAVRRAA